VLEVPPSALPCGLVNDRVGTQASRTIMLTELRLLLEACPSRASLEDYRAAVVEDNALLKRTVATRRESLRRLRELYALTPTTLLFHGLRDLWDDRGAQPLLALLCAVARDVLLRSTAPAILAAPVGHPLTPHMLTEGAQESFHGLLGAGTLARIGRNAASSWQQSGHLRGHRHKVRAHADCHPAAVAYALLLGHLCGARGQGLFSTFWSSLLDAPPHILHEQALAASRQGWIEYRRAGDVVEVGFRHLLRGHPEASAL